ncbi:uncharacterized protein [Antedon mediterranea]|uniref:uncharacterized protein n=1 Tax=Antedon mediterranea TaxID=105859 RepID=UPI003AF6C6FE
MILFIDISQKQLVHILMLFLYHYSTNYSSVSAVSCSSKDSHTNSITCTASGINIECRQCAHTDGQHHTVDCINRQFSEIPRCNTEGVENLNLRKNRIEQLNDDFEEYVNLETLYLEENELTEIKPAAFHKLTVLNDLRLNKNVIEILHEEAFEGLNELEIMYLSSNKLKSIPASTFHNLPKLKKLFIGNNLLSSLPNDVFHGSMITHLDLSHNFLTGVHSEMFKDLSDLESLVLRNNNLTEFPEIALEFMPKMTRFNLAENQFDCNCQSDVINLSRKMKQHSRWTPPTCLNGMNFLELEQDCPRENARTKQYTTSHVTDAINAKSRPIDRANEMANYELYIVILLCFIVLFCAVWATHLLVKRYNRGNINSSTQNTSRPNAQNHDIDTISSRVSSPDSQQNSADARPVDANQNNIVLSCQVSDGVGMASVTVQRNFNISLTDIEEGRSRLSPHNIKTYV